MGDTVWKVLRVGAFLLTAAFLGFIFFNSMQDSVASDAQSDSVKGVLQSFFDWLHIDSGTATFLVRKAGHLLEFFVLGCLLCVDIRILTRNWWARIFAPLFFGILFPVLDETIQLFTPGRSSEVRDVLIDFCGVCIGVAVATTILALLFDRKKKT